MSKYYFRFEDSEMCYNDKYFQEIMKDEGLYEIEVFEAHRVSTKDFFWCREHQVCEESGEGVCGSNCKEYKPRNGKNGRCVHHSNTFEYGNKTILTVCI